ncbi:lysozyme inhibitor LprI family protein [Jiella avicenniae]|uniref:DUF1311 domain-containing protein n=1 Tax=Jiella avicenniae TaxID=2907202 RepID=A0A9X1T5P5_9HYPH|nr:lysozyme inhibitor LprI family protein [Jiella avicenniae]MCE7029786.1 DUF1311 domain-containing protein [Jiella avicenniae]
MKRFALILLPVLVLAHPAAAAGPDVAADAAALKACVEGAKDDPRSCIETVVDPCVDGLSSETETGVNGCYDREAEAWDTVLNENYKAAMKDASSYDAEAKENGGDPGAADGLKKAQRAWIAFRDAECDRLYARNMDGTIRFTVYAACQNRMTAERAIELGLTDEPR